MGIYFTTEDSKPGLDALTAAVAHELSERDSLLTAAIVRDIPYVTTMAGVLAAVQGIEALVEQGMDVESLQEYASRLRSAGAEESARGVVL